MALGDLLRTLEREAAARTEEVRRRARQEADRVRAEADAARDVAAVAVHRAAEVAEHDVTALDDTGAGMVVRAGGVLAGGDDGEVDRVVALDEQPGGDVGRHLRFRPPDERDVPGLELGGHPVRCRSSSLQGRDLGLVLAGADRPDELAGPAER